MPGDSEMDWARARRRAGKERRARLGNEGTMLGGVLGKRTAAK